MIPAYNEQATIQPLVEQVLEQQPTQLLVVNDSSSDKTAAILQAIADSLPATSPLQIIDNDHNLGKAGSLWRGFELAITNKWMPSSPLTVTAFAIVNRVFASIR